MYTILVTGATGNVGRPLVATLAQRGLQVRAVTRNTHAAFPSHVAPVPSVEQGLPGADALFLNSRALMGQLERTVDAARNAGVRRLVGLSAINADDDVSRQPSRVRGDRNREVDELVSTSGLEWVSLRPSVFASNFAGMWGAQLRGGDVVSGPYAAASVAPIADADVAAVAAVALAADGLLGQRLPLTGPQSLTNAQLMELIGAALGRGLRYSELSPEQVRQRFVDIGFPEAFADAYLAMLAPTLDEPATVTRDVERILGRPATPFVQWVRDHRGLFTN